MTKFGFCLLSTILLLSSLAATASDHNVNDRVVFKCVTKSGKDVLVQQLSEVVSYQFGLKPDIKIEIPTQEFIWKEFTGSGASTTIMDFLNKNTTYEVTYVGQFKGAEDVFGYITVLKDSSVIAQINCRNGSIKFNSSYLKTKASS